MIEIECNYELESSNPYEILVNERPVGIFDSPNGTLILESLDVPKINMIEFKGSVKINKLMLDGIDLEHFVFHGFMPNKGRGNQGESVKYFYQLPIWHWFLKWKEHDNSTFRELSKSHQGFVPL
tara:strand:- start:607 stop:978 length:372 start_codon:yes stop_codon:yes gene_type:complete